MIRRQSLFVLVFLLTTFGAGTAFADPGLGPPTLITDTIQSPFLTDLKVQGTPVSIYLVNGIKLQGTIDDFDSYVILLGGGATTQMVYKHAISTIIPARPN